MPIPFDPNQHMDKPRAAGATKYPHIPSAVYQAECVDATLRQSTIRSGERAGQTLTSLDLTWRLLDNAVCEKMGRDRVTVRQSIILDWDDEAQDLREGEGLNIRHNIAREAFGLNNDSYTFRSWVGQVGLVDVVPQGDYDQVVKATRN